MSTEALVGMEIKHGLVRYIHVSHDGYFTGAGESILTLYQARGATEALLNMGDRRSVQSNSVTESFKHNYVDTEGEWEPKIANNQTDFLTKMEHYGADFAYLQTMDGEWTCYSREAGWWRPLKQRLAELKDRGNAEFRYYALGYIDDNHYYSTRITLKGPAKQTTVENSDILNIEVYVEKYQWFRKAEQHEVDEIKCFMIQKERVTERLMGKPRVSRDPKTVQERIAEDEKGLMTHTLQPHEDRERNEYQLLDGIVKGGIHVRFINDEELIDRYNRVYLWHDNVVRLKEPVL